MTIQRICGILIILAVFGGVMWWIAKESSWKIALSSMGYAVLISGVVAVGVYLIVHD